ncbi:ABC transporter ATP-binding protein [Hyphococcus sp.]|uniref:ABC transporter ATP-binding protein n=1 Tax=Hyphococcus sp. TaxID=2038636 RepID=UPI003CCB8B9C
MSVLVSVSDLGVHFRQGGGVFSAKKPKTIRAVDHATFDIKKGETFSLVGESGCGKSTLARAILQLQPATSGKVYFDGIDLSSLSPKDMRKLRRRMQMIFQDPFTSLNPRMTIGQIIGEPLVIHGMAAAREISQKTAEILETVGLSRKLANRYPHEFSGGQRQRVGIARAIAVNPDFIICDEAIAALDVSVQAQIINLLSDLQEELDLTYLFIAHDLAVVKHLSHRIAAMYAGKIVEIADRDSLYKNPRHPYTQLLLSAVPTPDPRAGRKTVSASVTAKDRDIPLTGCVFANRCPLVTDECRHDSPALREVAPGHHVACIHVQ